VSTLGNITATPPIFAKPFEGIHLIIEVALARSRTPVGSLDESAS
jgi:hypothetical protein